MVLVSEMISRDPTQHQLEQNILELQMSIRSISVTRTSMYSSVHLNIDWFFIGLMGMQKDS